MKLSEAIRLGAMLRPQYQGAYFGGGGSCALGAALEAIGRLAYNEVLQGCSGDLEFPIIAVSAGCPICTFDVHRLGCTVTHLNDEHGWTREAIADWVATIEAQQDQQGEADGAVLELREVITLAQKVG